MEIFYGIGLPFLGTSLGAACVFFMKKALKGSVQCKLMGFAVGIMMAASIWSLLIPAIDQSASMGRLSFAPAVVGFWCGILFLILINHVVPHLHRKSGQIEGPKAQLQRTTMMLLAVTIHNIPEGMAVGAVEPVGAALTIFAAQSIVPAMPYLLSFAAGAMLYVVVKELIPEIAQSQHSNSGTLCFAAGFSVMMILDVALG